jgi:hypothetical protein
MRQRVDRAECRYSPPASPERLLVLAIDMSFAVRSDLHVQAHRMAADGAVFDVVLVGAG